MKSNRRLPICATSIAAFMAASAVSPGVTYTVNLGDTALTVPAGSPAGGNVLKLGKGSAIITGAQTYGGPTVVQEGALVISNINQLGTTSSITIGHVPALGTVGNTGQTQGVAAGQLVLGGGYAAQNFAFPAVVNISGGGPGGNGVALLSVGTNNLSGGIVASSTSGSRFGNTFGMTTINGYTVGGTQVSRIEGNGNLTISGLASTGTGTFDKAGAGTLILPGVSTNTGVVQASAGFVRISTASNLGVSTAANGINFNLGALEVRNDASQNLGRGISVATNNGTLNLDRAVATAIPSLNETVTVASLTLAANRNFTLNARNGYGLTVTGTAVGGGAEQNTLTNNGNGLFLIGGNVWNNNDGTARTLTVTGVGNFQFDGNILAGTAANQIHNVTKAGAGTLLLNGTGSTYLGATNINGGTIATRQIAGGLGSVASTAAINISGGTLNYLGSTGSGNGETTTRLLNLSGTTGGATINANQTGSALIFSNANVTASGSGNKTMTLGGSNALDNELVGSIANGGTGATSLAKTGSGTWVLSGANAYTGTTTISNGTLKLKANADAISSVLADTSTINFNVDAAQAAGGRLLLTGRGAATTETVGTINPIFGHGTVAVQNAGFTTTLAAAGLSATSGSIGASVNFVATAPLDVITLGGAIGFVRGNAYFNGANFAFGDIGNVLRSPVYGTDAGFNTTAVGPLTTVTHNEITGSFSQAAETISSLKISGGQTLTLTGPLTVNTGAGTVGGILVDGGNAVIAQGVGGAITQGLGAGAAGGALVVRVNQLTDSLTLNVPITNSTTQGLSKNGLGTLILGAANAQSGSTNINEGTIRLAPGGTLSANNQALSIRQGATLDINGISTGNSISAFNGAGLVTNGGSIAANLQVGNNNGGGTFTGMIEDGASVVNVIKQGTAGQTWSGANTYTGSTTINSTGNISVSILTDIGSPSGIGRGVATSDATNAASLVFGGTTGALNYVGGRSISVDRLFTFAGIGANAGGRILSNPVIDAITNATANNSALILNKTNPIAFTPAASTVAQILTLGGASIGDNQINLQLTDPAGVASARLSVTKADAGVWKLGNTSNNYTGTTTIQGGRLIAETGTLPSGSPLVLTAGGVLETSGTFNRALAVTATPGVGTVTWIAPGANTGNGGFAASADKLVVDIGPGAPLTWGTGGFLTPSTAGVSANLILNSATALSEVEVRNSIDLGAVNRTFQVDDNGTTSTDYATLTGVLSGAAGTGITKAGGGILYLLGANTYTGTTVLGGGQTYIQTFGNTTSTSSNLGAGPASLSLNGGALQYVGAGESSDRPITASASPTIESNGFGALVLTGPFTNAGTTGKTLSLSGLNTDANEISSVLSNAVGNSTAALGITKNSGGTWIVSGNNTHTGNTQVNTGNLGIGNNSALGTGNLLLLNANLFADGGDRTIANPVTNFAGNATSGIIGDNSLTFTGPVTVGVGGNSTVNNFLAAGKTFTITNTVTVDPVANRTLTFGGNGRTVISGAILNDPGTAARVLALTLSSGTLEIGAAAPNTFTGAVTINGGTMVLNGGSGQILPNGVGTIANNVTFGNTVLPATLDLNGQSETINGLIGTSTGVKTITSATPAVLTAGDNNQLVNFNGSITGGVGLIKTGSAAGTLSGPANTYTGQTTVLGGTLAFPISGPTASSAITVAGAAGLSLINGTGTPLSGLTTLNLGAGAGTASIGLDVGTNSDTLTVTPAAITANNIQFSIGPAAGFGGSPTYTLLSAPAGGLDGATYSISGVVPGGYTYSLTPSATSVVLNATPSGVFNIFWGGDTGTGSWSTYLAGNTNWENSVGADPAATPGPLDTVTFSSTVPATAATIPNPLVTTLDLPVTIDSLEFNGSNSSTVAARVSIAPGTGGTLTISPASSTDGINLPDNAGIASITAPVILANDQTWTVGSVGALRPELIVTGPLSGTGNLTKLGAGTASLTGNSTRTGRTEILNGTIRINTEAALGVNPGAPTANQLLINGGILRSIAALVIDDANRGITIGASGGAIDTTGGNITVANTTSIVGGILRKDGGNTLILNGPNTHAGTVINGGIVRAGDGAALGAGPVNMINSATILEVADGISITNAINATNAGNDKAIRLLAGAATGTVSGPIVIGEQSIGNFRLQAPAGGTLTVSSAISSLDANSTAGVRVNEVAGQTGVLVMSGANTYLGPTEVRQGTLRNGASDVIPGAVTVNAAVAANPTATYDLDGNNETVTALTFGANSSSNAAYVNTVTTGAGTLTLAGNVTTNVNPPGNQNIQAILAGNVAMTAVRTFSVANAANQAVDLAVSAVLTGGVGTGITKTGLGTMSLTANSPAYTGATSVTAGTLLVNGSISGSAVTVSGTGILGGTGTVGAITATAGSVSPGTSIGTLNATSLTMSGTASFALEINTNPTASTDLLNLTGPLSLSMAGTPLAITDLGGNVPLAMGTTLTFITYSGLQTGLFSVGGTPINEPDVFFFGVNQFQLDYDLGGNSVALVVVPEPGIAVSLLGGFGMLVGLQRIRRRGDRRA